jgi:predicted aspartyl protease
MGTFRVTIEIGDPAGRHYETVGALVDTGATYPTVPAPLLERLGIVPHVRDTFILADGRRVERDIGRTWIRVDGRAELTLVVFGDPDTPSLLGAYTLEGLRLAADPVGRSEGVRSPADRLIPVPAYLLGIGRRCGMNPTRASWNAGRLERRRACKPAGLLAC